MQPYVVVLHVQVFACSMMMYRMAGNLFWRIGGFECNPPIFLPPKFMQSYSFPFNKAGCAMPID